MSDKHVPGPALREVAARRIFVLVLSPAALTSTWVRAEYERATESGRVILPVVIAPINADQLPGDWGRLAEGGRAGDRGLAPLSQWDAIGKTLELLLSRYVPANGTLSPAAPNADMFYTSARLLRERAEKLLGTDENAVEVLIERGRNVSPPGDGEIPAGSYAIWCVVANVRKDVLFGAGGRETREGTKHFPPGAKVYCFPPLWGDGYDYIKVIGHHRESGRFATLVMRSNRLTNWRVDLAYSPHVIKEMAEYWDGTLASRAAAEGLAEICRGREQPHVETSDTESDQGPLDK